MMKAQKNNQTSIIYNFFLMSLLSLQLLHSQNEEIELITQQSDSSLAFIAKNSTDVTNQFTLNITVKNLIGY